MISDLRRRGPVRNEGQLQVVDDPVDNGMLPEEGDDLHRPSTFWIDHGVDLVDLEDHLGPALGGEAAGLLLDDPERKSRQARLADLAPMGVGVQAVIAHHDLAFVRDMGDDPGDELLTTYEEGRGFFTVKGPVLANFVLADEINRSPPKVQSAWE